MSYISRHINISIGKTKKRTMALIKGQKYSKKEIGFKKPQYRNSSAIINGERHFLITINGKYNNECKNGKLIVDTRLPSQVVQQNLTLNEVTHIFVRKFSDTTLYEYIGDLNYIAPHDKKRNEWVIS